MVNRSLAHSAFQFFVETFRHWGFFLSGAASGLVGWILTAADINGIPAETFLWAGGLLVVVAMIRAYHDARVRRDELLEARLPKFEIVFEPPSVSQSEKRPFLQVLKFRQAFDNPLPVGARVRTVSMSDRRYRVGVRNLSTDIVKDVHLVLVKCDPAGNHVHVGHRLLVMDSDPPAAERDLPPSSTGEPTLFFDVVNELGAEGTVPKHFQFCFQNYNLSQPVHAGAYRIVLRAEGGGHSHERSFTIRKSESGAALTIEPH